MYTYLIHHYYSVIVPDSILLLLFLYFNFQLLLLLLLLLRFRENICNNAFVFVQNHLVSNLLFILFNYFVNSQSLRLTI